MINDWWNIRYDDYFEYYVISDWWKIQVFIMFNIINDW